MPIPSYLDFDLEIEPAGDDYRAQVLNSPAGQPSATFRLPFSAQEVEDLRLQLATSGHGIGRDLTGQQSAEATDPKEFGGRLFGAVFSGELLACLRTSLSMAREGGVGLRLRLRLGDAPALAVLPWEYLYDTSLGRFLCLSAETPLVRFLDLPEAAQPMTVQAPLRVLVMISSPSDHALLDVEREWANLKRALGELIKQDLVVLDRLETATLDALQERLRSNTYHVFHFIGHGGFDEAAQDGVLLLEADDGKGIETNAEEVGTLLHDHRSLRLAVLNACEGAAGSGNDLFAGTAQSLVRQGLPAVIAMQRAISDQAAIKLAGEFYKALKDNYPVDAALAEARKAIHSANLGTEWGTPVLYMRAPDGRLFDVGGTGAAQSQSDVKPLNPAGVVWLGAAAMGVTLWAGLTYLFLYQWPFLSTMASVMFGVLAAGFGWLGIRDDRDLPRRLSHFISRSRASRAGISLFVLLAVVGWIGLGVPRVRAMLCGPLGCAAHGVHRFAIGTWKNLTPSVGPGPEYWTDQTRTALYQKLSQVASLQGIGLDNPQVTDEVRASLDYFIAGSFSYYKDIRLSATITGRGGQFVSTLEASGPVTASDDGPGAKLPAIQDDLVEKIVAALKVPVPPDLAERIADTPTHDPLALQRNNEAVIRIDEGDLDGAEPLLRLAIESDPNYADAHNNLGDLLRRRGQYAAAIESFQRAIDILPRYPVYYYNLGYAYDVKGDYAAAVSAYNRVVELDPTSMKMGALNNLGFAYLELGNLDQAADVLRRGLTLAPENANLHKNLGRVLLEQMRVTDAIEQLDQAVQLKDGRYPEALYYLAVAYQMAKQVDQACVMLKRYSEQAAPDNRAFSQTNAHDVDEAQRLKAAQELIRKLGCS